jgi:5-methylcytosine-specific restriction endonuclease McrA
MKIKIEEVLTEFHRDAAEAERACDRLVLLQAVESCRVESVSVKRREKLRRAFLRRRSDDFAVAEAWEWHPCFVCWKRGTHRHHVVPLYQGGDNRQANIVFLCASCHEDVHPWMRDVPAARGARVAAFVMHAKATGFKRKRRPVAAPSVSRDMRPRLVR